MPLLSYYNYGSGPLFLWSATQLRSETFDGDDCQPRGGHEILTWYSDGGGPSRGVLPSRPQRFVTR